MTSSEPTQETGGTLTLLCPTCDTRFGVSLEGRGPENVHVTCTACGHLFTTDEMLMAMAASLNDLLDLTRIKLTPKS